MYNSPNRVLQKRIQHMFHTLSLSVVAINVVGTPVHNVPPKHQSTIVTAYFKIPSKHSFKEYDEWSANMLSLQDPMVIYTTEDLVPTMKRLRAHAMERTLVVPMKLKDTWIARNQNNTNYWEGQLQKDPEKAIHRSYRLFWIWLSKSWFVNDAIGKNPFKSALFVWSDIGSFRTTEYNGKLLVAHPEIVPASAMLIMSSRTPTITTPWPVKGKDSVWVAGAHMAGRIDAWTQFHRAFKATILGYVDRGLFVGEDQAVIQSTCQQHTSLCAVVTPDMVKGNVWFGLQDALHRGVDTGQLWRPRTAHPLWMVWLGSKIKGFHKSCWESCLRVHEHTNVEVRLVTSNTISDWIPSLHPSFHLLDNVAKSDYLRAELLYLYGGIYLDTDVTCMRSLEPVWNVLTGKVVGGGSPLTKNLNNNMLGPFLPRSHYVSQWHHRLHKHMDTIAPKLEACAKKFPSGGGGIAYPTPILVGFSICGFNWGYAIDFEKKFARKAYKDGILVRTFKVCTGQGGKQDNCDVMHRGCAGKSKNGCLTTATGPPSSAVESTSPKPLRILVACPQNSGCTAFVHWLCSNMLKAGRNVVCLPDVLPRNCDHTILPAFPSTVDVVAKYTMERSMPQNLGAIWQANPLTHVLHWWRNPVETLLSLRKKAYASTCGGLYDKMAFQDEVFHDPSALKIHNVDPVVIHAELFVQDPRTAISALSIHVAHLLTWKTQKWDTLNKRYLTPAILSLLPQIAYNGAWDHSTTIHLKNRKPWPTDEVLQVLKHQPFLASAYNVSSRKKCLNADFRPNNPISVWTMLTDGAGYVDGAVKLGASVRQHTSTPLDMVVLVLDNKPLAKETWMRLRATGWQRCVVERIAPLNEKGTFGRFRDQFTKLHVWGMTMYDTLLYLDLDTLALRPIDGLLRTRLGEKKIGVARDYGGGKWRPGFNMGVFLIHPNAEEHARLLNLQKGGEIKFDTAMSEQGFLNVVYRNEWYDIGFKYNANLAIFSQDRSYWDKHENDIRIVHYTMNKPWKCSRAYNRPCSWWNSKYLPLAPTK